MFSRQSDGVAYEQGLDTGPGVKPAVYPQSGSGFGLPILYGFRFQIVAIDPKTLDTRVLLDHACPPMGAVTVALPFCEQVYLGTFAGDRIAQVSAAVLMANRNRPE
jgi:hypothetical protein